MRSVLILGLLCLAVQTQTAENNTSTSRTDPQYHCVWYGECNKKGSLSQYCPYNGTAKPLDNEGQRLLEKWCPDLLKDRSSGVNTCCNTAQLAVLNKYIKIAANFLQTCPSCMHNFQKHICHMTCSPEQSRYIEITDIQKNKNGTEYIQGINYYITNHYIEGTFNSCLQVREPSTGQRALDFMCGTWGASRCTPKRWFYYMGDAILNPYVLFQITYEITSKPIGEFSPMDEPITPSINEACSFEEDRDREECSEELDTNRDDPILQLYPRYLDCYWNKNLHQSGHLNFDGTRTMIVQILNQINGVSEDNGKIGDNIIEKCKHSPTSPNGSSVAAQSCILDGIDQHVKNE